MFFHSMSHYIYMRYDMYLRRVHAARSKDSREHQ